MFKKLNAEIKMFGLWMFVTVNENVENIQKCTLGSMYIKKNLQLSLKCIRFVRFYTSTMVVYVGVCVCK